MQYIPTSVYALCICVSLVLIIESFLYLVSFVASGSPWTCFEILHHHFRLVDPSTDCSGRSRAYGLSRAINGCIIRGQWFCTWKLFAGHSSPTVARVSGMKSMVTMRVFCRFLEGYWIALYSRFYYRENYWHCCIFTVRGVQVCWMFASSVSLYVFRALTSFLFRFVDILTRKLWKVPAKTWSIFFCLPLFLSGIFARDFRFFSRSPPMWSGYKGCVDKLATVSSSSISWLSICFLLKNYKVVDLVHSLEYSVSM